MRTTRRRTRATIEGLTPGTSYAFRLHAIGALGEGSWGDEAVKRAV